MTTATATAVKAPKARASKAKAPKALEAPKERILTKVINSSGAVSSKLATGGFGSQAGYDESPEQYEVVVPRYDTLDEAKQGLMVAVNANKTYKGNIQGVILFATKFFKEHGQTGLFNKLRYELTRLGKASNRGAILDYIAANCGVIWHDETSEFWKVGDSVGYRKDKSEDAKGIDWEALAEPWWDGVQDTLTLLELEGVEKRFDNIFKLLTANDKTKPHLNDEGKRELKEYMVGKLLQVTAAQG